MKKYATGIVILLLFVPLLWFWTTITEYGCKPEALAKDFTKVLPCYLERDEPDFHWQVINKESMTVAARGKESAHVTRYFLELTSQRWSEAEKGGVDYPVWKHRLAVYVPDKIVGNTALLFVNSGMRYSSEAETPGQLPFEMMAARTQSVIVDLKDVPNQSLRFNGGEPLSEDALIAYTWQQFMTNPEANSEWPLRLPMVKSVAKAMDAVQAQLKLEDVTVDQFVLSGASKRGWTALLAAAVDKRVAAVIPLVADYVNVPAMMKHLFDVYKNGNPAIAAYMPVKKMMGTEPMTKLLTIIDPYQYRQFLTMPKFFVSAAGDQFVPTDTTQFFFSDLPGEKWMRVLPNRGHFIFREDPQLILDTMESFYGAFLKNNSLPKLTWQQTDKGLEVVSSIRPKSAVFWQASNPVARDFRKSEDNPDVSSFKAQPLQFEGQDVYRVNVVLPKPEAGWHGSFVEVTYDNAPYQDLVFTTRLFVTPERYPES